MRTTEVLREAWRDIASGAGAAVVCAGVLAVLVAGVVGVRTVAVADDVRAAARWVASGAATQVFTAAGRIDGRACAALADEPDVLAAGAFRKTEDGMVVAALPGTSIPTYEVTGGATALFGVAGTTGDTGVLVAPEVAEVLGVGPGQQIATPDGPVPVAGVYAYPDDGRDPELSYAVLAPTVDDGAPFDACWATVWPQDETAVSALRRTLLAATGSEDGERSTLGQLNPRSGTAFLPSDPPAPGLLESVALALGLVVGCAAVLRRRLSIASDRHVGVRVTAQAFGIAVQHLAWGAVAAALALAVSVVLVRGLPPGDGLPIVADGAVLCVLGLVGAVTGGAAAVPLVRERALHRYFRTR
ncbi:hypothetical protein AABM26_05325 [Curtobacterium aetherium]|uniref:hypothetical protein n=1 Tax=Curtobacterium aetherium TaxID=2841594 RepID=UPI003B517FFF